MSEIRNYIRKQALEVFKDKVYAVDMEIGVFNKSIQDADKHNVQKKWSEPLFRRI